MGNRAATSNPNKKGVPRDFVKERAAREHYERRKENLPVQVWQFIKERLDTKTLTTVQVFVPVHISRDEFGEGAA